MMVWARELYVGPNPSAAGKSALLTTRESKLWLAQLFRTQRTDIS
jgi:hypothetical protein